MSVYDYDLRNLKQLLAIIVTVLLENPSIIISFKSVFIVPASGDNSNTYFRFQCVMCFEIKVSDVSLKLNLYTSGHFYRIKISS